MITKINTALISVSDKTDLEKISYFLAGESVKIISTGGTYKMLKDAGILAKKVADITKFNEIMGGRVKTLHPLIHGGLLGDREVHKQDMEANNIEGIDLLILNLYPFEATVEKFNNGEASLQDVIENIDIGGPAMLRSAAKNHKYVTVVIDPSDYDLVIDEIKEQGGISLETRQNLAQKAFSYVAYYDAIISDFFINNISNKQGEEVLPSHFALPIKQEKNLRYGENPHQKGFVFKNSTSGLINAEQIQGKELSYNNLNDADAAYALIKEFKKPSAVIVKHASPCGVATGVNLVDAYKQAFLCDSVSAFGGIIALNRELDGATATKISKIFSEVIIAPAISDEAKEILSKKKNLRVLITKGKCTANNKLKLNIKNISGGFLAQSDDEINPLEYSAEDILAGKVEGFNVPTKTKPSKEQIEEMLFAMSVAKHTKSNAIVLVQSNGEGIKTVGIGGGQTNRLDSVRFSAERARELAKNFNSSERITLASDAFFPFADGVEAAIKLGVSSVIQPGGSVRDDEVIKACDDAGIAMLFTGTRHFKH